MLALMRISGLVIWVCTGFLIWSAVKNKTKRYWAIGRDRRRLHIVHGWRGEFHTYSKYSLRASYNTHSKHSICKPSLAGGRVQRAPTATSENVNQEALPGAKNCRDFQPDAG